MTPQFIATQIKHWNRQASAMLKHGNNDGYVQAIRVATAYKYIRELQAELTRIETQIRKALK